jgi:phosphoserine aminotransferase
MTKRVFNFSAGPCALPLPALERAAADFVDYQGSGMSLIEMSHRGKYYDKVHYQAMANMRELLSIPEGFDILFLQGGATTQFAMIPMNFHKEGKTAEYVKTGTWAKKAIGDSEKLGSTRVVWTDEENNFARMPAASELKVGEDASYFHITSNETIGGIEFQEYPDTGSVPMFDDASSHIMSRPVDFSKFGMVYGGAQKNLGPAGATFVIIRKSLVETCNENVPAYLSYKTHAPKDSLYNTPPVFAIYMLKLTLDWVKEVGGLKEMEARAIKRSDYIYNTIAQSDGWFRSPVDEKTRSRMNVCFRLPSEDLEKKFIAEALEANMSGLKGHRSVGGCRASMYNAMPVEGAAALAQFMVDFRKANS